MNNSLNILMQSSDFYCPFAGVAMESLFENNTDIESLTVYLISDNISDKNLEKINLLSQRFGRKIVIIDGNKISSMLSERDCPKYNNSYATYYKLLVAQFINDNIDRLLYLDSDLIIDGSLKELICLDMQESVLAMAIDVVSENHKRNINCSERNYFNAGVILFDFVKWKSEGYADKILDHFANIHADYPLVDQDILNIIMKGKICCMELKYNFNADFYLYKNYNMVKKVYGVELYYSEEDFYKALNEPVVYHCMATVTSRPWYSGSKHSMVEKWDRYLLRSPWKDFKKPVDNRSFVFKVQGALYFILPRRAFAFINRNVTAFIQNRRAAKSKVR